MNPTSARALAPRCARAARAARAPRPGVAPPPAALRPCASPADSDLPPGLHQVRLRQLAAGPRALPVHRHPLGHLLPARLRRGMPPPNPAPAGRPGDRGPHSSPQGRRRERLWPAWPPPRAGPHRKPSFLISHRRSEGSTVPPEPSREPEFGASSAGRAGTSGRKPRLGAKSRSRESREGDVRELIRVMGGTTSQHPGHAPVEWETDTQGSRCPRDREPVVSVRSWTASPPARLRIVPEFHCPCIPSMPRAVHCHPGQGGRTGVTAPPSFLPGIGWGGPLDSRHISLKAEKNRLPPPALFSGWGN